jgi:ribosomal protein L32
MLVLYVSKARTDQRPSRMQVTLEEANSCNSHARAHQLGTQVHTHTN